METPTAAESRQSIGSQRNPASQEAILAAAEAIITESGLSAFSIEAVARRAKAGKPTIYRWWPSKAALLLDVYHRQKRPAVRDGSGDLRQDLILFMSDLLSHWREGGGTIFRSLIAESQTDEATLALLTDYAERRRKETGVVIEAAKERGDVPETVDAQLVMELLSAHAWHRLLTGRLDMPETEIAQIVDYTLSGILPR